MYLNHSTTYEQLEVFVTKLSRFSNRNRQIYSGRLIPELQRELQDDIHLLALHCIIYLARSKARQFLYGAISIPVLTTLHFQELSDEDLVNWRRNITLFLFEYKDDESEREDLNQLFEWNVAL